MIGIAILGGILFFWWKVDGFGIGKRSVQENIPDLPDGAPYTIFTSEYDVEVKASDYLQLVLENAEPGTTYLDRDGRLCLGDEEQWDRAIAECEALSQELQGTWQSLEAQIVDLSFAFENAAITLLIDQSGSLRGEAIQHLAASLRWISRKFEERQISYEILGFTTMRWKGGKSREKWLSEGKLPYPGRLNDLLHIVYKASGDPYNPVDFNTMLYPTLIKENVDGEALQWAVHRLQQRAEKRKILLVVSDGAPVDDSTLSENGPSLMERHLLEVIEQIESTDEIQIGGVGIGFDVSRYYSISSGDDDFRKIPESIIEVSGLLISH